MPVAPYLGEIYRLAFGNAGMVAHPNRWLTQPEELVLAQNVTFENDLVQKESAAAEYDAAGIGIATESPYGTFGGNTDSAMYAIWLPASSTVSFLGVLATGNQYTGAGWVLATTGAASVGDLVVLAFGQSQYSSDIPLLTAVQDNRGNIYKRLGEAPAIPGMTAAVELWGSILTTALIVGDHFALYFKTTASDYRTLVAARFRGVRAVTTADLVSDANVSAQGINTATFSSVTNTYLGANFPALCLAAVEWLNPVQTPTWQGGFTQRAIANLGAGPPTVFANVSLASRVVFSTVGIVAQYDWKADVKSTPAGTITVVLNSNVVTGAGTSFTTVFVPGDEIIASGETEIVDHITSNTQLETVTPWQQGLGAVAFDRRSGPRVITSSLTGHIYKDSPDQGGNTGNLDATSLVSGLTNTRRRGRFISGGKEAAANNRKLFYFNGVDPVQVLSGDGATMTAIATPPADWGTVADAGKQPINGIVHQGCLFAFGNLNDPYRIYKSDPGNHELFTGTGAGQYPIASNVGERLFGAAEFQGVLFLWKYPVGIFYFDDTDPNFLNWTYHQRSEALGCAPSPHAVLPIDQDVLFCAADGHFHLLSAVSDLGGTRTSDLTRRLGLHKWMRDNVDTTALSQMVSAWDPATKIASFGVQSTSASGLDNDLILRFDFALVDRGGPVRFSYSTLWSPSALTIKRRNYIDRPALLIGGTATCYFVDPFHYGYRTIAGVTQGFAHSVTTPQLDFSDQDPQNKFRRKHYDALELVFADPAVLTGNPLSVGVYIDNVLKQTLTYTNASRRPMLQLRVGDGYECALAITSADSSTADIPQVGALVYWRPGGQDKSRNA
jgi:hypothetical protein